MRILVTGSEGNIGKPLSKRLTYPVHGSHEVMGVDLFPGYSNCYQMCNINNGIELEEVFHNFQPEVCFALAALYGRLANERFYHNAYDTNIIGLANTIHLCKKYKTRLIFTSSSEIYGNITEVMDEETTNLRPNNRYGFLKLTGEQMIQYEVKNHGLDAVILRPNMIISPDEPEGEYRSVIIRMCEHFIKGAKFDLYKNSSRSFLHINDAIRVFEKAIRLPCGTVLNVAHPNQVNIGEIYSFMKLYIDHLPDYKSPFIEQRVAIKELPDKMTLNKPVNANKMMKVLFSKAELESKSTNLVDWMDLCKEVIDAYMKREKKTNKRIWQ